MAETDIGSAVASDLKNQLADYSIDPIETDGATGAKETTYINTDWGDRLGAYQTIPELNIAVDTRATWTVGKGFKADDETTLLLDTIKGWGKDTFNTILENMLRTYFIGGDAFAEIITDEKGILLNLKPLDPSSIKIVADKNGLITRYEQISKIAQKFPKKFAPERIFHLARNRVADEIHGRDIIKPLLKIILARNEAMADWQRVLHRNVDPLIIWHLDTDDPAEIAAFKAKNDAAKKEGGEQMYIPKGAVVPEVVTTAGNATLNPLPWIENLNRYFWQATGGVDVVIGATANLTEASGKIKYLAFQQTTEEDQLYVEEQVLSQLNLVLELEFPASLENEALSDKPKEEEGDVNNPKIEEEQAFQPNDTKSEMEGKK